MTHALEPTIFGMQSQTNNSTMRSHPAPSNLTRSIHSLLCTSAQPGRFIGNQPRRSIQQPEPEHSNTYYVILIMTTPPPRRLRTLDPVANPCCHARHLLSNRRLRTLPLALALLAVLLLLQSSTSVQAFRAPPSPASRPAPGRLAATRGGSGSAEGDKGVVIIFPAQFGVAKDYDEVSKDD